MRDAPEIDPDRPETWPASARDYLARHRPAPPDTRLRDALREEIRAGGPITFARLMARALYDPEHGYYASTAGRVGTSGDYLTAPTTHPAFGALLCRRVAQIWEQLGRPHPFVLAEVGPGTGALAAQILGAALGDQHGGTETRRGREEEGIRREGDEQTAPASALSSSPLPLSPSSSDSVSPCLRVDSLPSAFGGALRYRLIEPFVAWREVQHRRLAPWGERVTWHADLEEQPDPPHLLLANELLDALPVHRAVRRAVGLRELYVSVDERGELVEREGLLSTVELERYFERLGLQLPLDTPVEVGLAGEAWLCRVLTTTRGGWVWLLDYGAEAAALYATTRAGTLRAFHDHALSADLLARIGAQDLTADVDFTTLIRTAEAEGWTVVEFTTQRDLLLSLGLREYLHPGRGVQAFGRSGVQEGLPEPLDTQHRREGAPLGRHSGGAEPGEGDFAALKTGRDRDHSCGAVPVGAVPSSRPSSPEPPALGFWALLQLIDPLGLGAVRSLLLRDGQARLVRGI